MHLPDPAFPPLLEGHAVRAPRRAFESAVARARTGELGAGDVTWGRDVDRVDMAIVLEPTVPAPRAMEMLGVTLVAIGDSLGALVPPEVAVTFRWPSAIRVNGAEAGRVRVAMPAERMAEDVPDWMVVGIEIEIRRKTRASDPGLMPDVTDLQEEGCGELTRTELVESFGRHFLTWTHGWETEGFRAVHETLEPRLDGLGEEIELEHGARRYVGRFVGIDEHGSMVLETASGTILLPALDMVECPDEVTA